MLLLFEVSAGADLVLGPRLYYASVSKNKLNPGMHQVQVALLDMLKILFIQYGNYDNIY